MEPEKNVALSIIIRNPSKDFERVEKSLRVLGKEVQRTDTGTVLIYGSIKASFISLNCTSNAHSMILRIPGVTIKLGDLDSQFQWSYL